MEAEAENEDEEITPEEQQEFHDEDGNEEQRNANDENDNEANWEDVVDDSRSGTKDEKSDDEAENEERHNADDEVDKPQSPVASDPQHEHIDKQTADDIIEDDLTLIFDKGHVKRAGSPAVFKPNEEVVNPAEE
ncbi:hypothetical protein MMC21_004577 [Puttea exsequens]|nr:hypothetical protein [Puttea exsequens]